MRICLYDCECMSQSSSSNSSNSQSTSSGSGSDNDGDAGAVSSTVKATPQSQFGRARSGDGIPKEEQEWKAIGSGTFAQTFPKAGRFIGAYDIGIVVSFLSCWIAPRKLFAMHMFAEGVRDLAYRMDRRLTSEFVTP